MSVAGFTSTGSKRPDLLYDVAADGVPIRMRRSRGCIIEADDGSQYLDFISALGATALGYAHPDVVAAISQAAAEGGIGALAPELEEVFATELSAEIPMLESVRFLKSGAEGVAAAVRIARTATGRERVIGCGYHGWLDWCSGAAGVPSATRQLFDAIPFNDCERAISTIRAIGESLACVVIEPVIEMAPDHEWLEVLRTETQRAGALLVFDEVKTGFRIAIGGAVDRHQLEPDLLVLGKAMSSGMPLAAVGGRSTVMQHVDATWISSTTATEWISLAAARATLAVFRRDGVIDKLEANGQRLLMGLVNLADRHPRLVERASGIPQMCHLRYHDDRASGAVAVACARRGLLFKRSAYNFVTLAHTDVTIDRALLILADALAECDAAT